MKKRVLAILSILILTSTVALAGSKSTNSNELSNAIKMYKAGNYSGAYSTLMDITKDEPGNALAHYYLAISCVQIGKKTEAIINYKKTLLLVPEKSKLGRYANKGKVCLEAPDMCEEVSLNGTAEDNFITGKTGGLLMDKVKGEYEQLKLENFMREMNRSNDVNTDKFKEYKDFSSMNDSNVPTNEEIVAALRTLQKAGLANIGNYGNMDISMLTGGQQIPNNMFGIMGNSNLNSQLIQTMLTNNMSLGF